MNGYNDMMPYQANVMYGPMPVQTGAVPMPTYQYPQATPGMGVMPSMPSFPATGVPSEGIPITAPTGQPTGPAFPLPAPVTTTGAVPVITESETAPTTVQSTMYLAGLLRTLIGRRVRVEFLIGTAGTTDRAGILVGVGASYIILREETEDNLMVCDLYSIKFVTVYL